jgi:hypothetical protein
MERLQASGHLSGIDPVDDPGISANQNQNIILIFLGDNIYFMFSFLLA